MYPERLGDLFSRKWRHTAGLFLCVSRFVYLGLLVKNNLGFNQGQAARAVLHEISNNVQMFYETFLQVKPARSPRVVLRCTKGFPLEMPLCALASNKPTARYRNRNGAIDDQRAHGQRELKNRLIGQATSRIPWVLEERT